MPTNINPWGQGWGTFNPFQQGINPFKHKNMAIPSDIWKKYNPTYQSPYASDPTSSSARAAAGLDPMRTGTPEEIATWNKIQDFYKNPLQAMMQQFGMSGSNPSSGGGTQPDPYAGMTQLWRDPSGMIHDFGDNPQPTTQPNNTMDMSQMMNIFQLLNGMNSYQNRGRQNRDRGGNGYMNGMRSPGGALTTKPLITSDPRTTTPTTPPPTTTTNIPPPRPWIGEDPAYTYTQQ